MSAKTVRPLFAIAFALAGLSIALSPVQAAAAARGAYAVTLAKPLASPKQQIIDETLWKCAGDQCSAADAGSRPVIMCQRVAKKFGEVAVFTSSVGTLSAEDLAKCNAK